MGDCSAEAQETSPDLSCFRDILDVLGRGGKVVSGSLGIRLVKSYLGMSSAVFHPSFCSRSV